ncbi:MAG TPA: hypothetical protein VN327_17240, partial [Pseudonocardiaceae bacterium]|nr:hypothetical protein [Pseudonocardiaceae bacterium]
ALDTGYNYLGFTSHRTLARTAGDLLPEFMISTKVGFFPGSARAEHSLDPRRLRQAVEESVEDLCRPPDVVLLHNPERTLAALPPDAGVTAWPQPALPSTTHRQQDCAVPGASPPGTRDPCWPPWSAPR